MDSLNLRALHGLLAGIAFGALSVGCDEHAASATRTVVGSETASHAAEECTGSECGPGGAGPKVQSDASAELGHLDGGGTSGNGDGGASHDVAQPDTSTVAESGGGLPCAVKKIVSARCSMCHGDPPKFGAYMPLARYEDFQAAGATDASKKVRELVKMRINNSAKPMPPTSVTPLSAEQLSTLNDWLDQGAPSRKETCDDQPSSGGDGLGGGIDVSGLECHKFLAHADGDKNSKFMVGAAVDAYWSMTFAAPWTGPVYAKVIRPVIDNVHALHHWLFYEEPGADGSVTPSMGQHPDGYMVAGWGPGGASYDFRKFGDVGLELTGSSYLLELHYNSSDANAVDASGVEVCWQKQKPQNVVGMSWVGYDNWILAGDFGGDRTTWTGMCAPLSQEPIHILYVTPHMHQSGRHLKSIITGTDGSIRILHDRAFEFANQTTYEKKEVLMPGETITTTCTYDKPQSFGQGTAAEMCYLNTYSYPKGALADDGLWGTFAHGEGACLGQ